MNESTMPLTRALERAGLERTASCLTQLALRPNVLDVKPLTRVRRCERALRCWIRGEPDAHVEFAIAELLVAVLTLKLNPASAKRGDSCRSVPFWTGDPGELARESQE